MRFIGLKTLSMLLYHQYIIGSTFFDSLVDVLMHKSWTESFAKFFECLFLCQKCNGKWVVWVLILELCEVTLTNFRRLAQKRGHRVQVDQCLGVVWILLLRCEQHTLGIFVLPLLDVRRGLPVK